jgi:general stress protein 26
MTRDELLSVLRRYKLGIVASVSADGEPQAAVVGVAISDQFEIIFDTLSDTRKYANLRRDPRAALVIGWDHELTAQIQGLADFPSGPELERIQQCYFGPYPDGRERLAWPGITHVRIRPTRIRYSDFNQSPPLILEFSEADLAASST